MYLFIQIYIVSIIMYHPNILSGGMMIIDYSLEFDVKHASVTEYMSIHIFYLVMYKEYTVCRLSVL